MNEKLQDMKWHPLKSRIRSGPQTLGKTNPTKNGPHRRRVIQKKQKLNL